MNLGFWEMAFLVLLALMLFGPKRLPEIARQLGRFVAEFKRASNDFQSQIHQEISKLEMEETHKAIAEGATTIMPSVEDPDSITAALNRLTERIKKVPQDYDA